MVERATIVSNMAERNPGAEAECAEEDCAEKECMPAEAECAEAECAEAEAATIHAALAAFTCSNPSSMIALLGASSMISASLLRAIATLGGANASAPTADATIGTAPTADATIGTAPTADALDFNEKQILELSADTMRKPDIHFTALFVTFCQQSAQECTTQPSLGDGCRLQTMRPLSIKCYKLAASMVNSMEKREKQIKAEHPEWGDREVRIALMEADNYEKELKYSEVMNPTGVVYLDSREIFNKLLSWSAPKLHALHSILEVMLPKVLSLGGGNILGICSGNGFVEALIAYYCEQNYPDLKVIATDEVGIAEQEQAAAEVLYFYPMWFSTLMRRSHRNWLDNYTATVNKRDAVHAAASVPGRMLVCSWPFWKSSIVEEANNAHYAIFDHYYELILYIGEGMHGCTGSNAMHEMLEQYYIPLQQGSCHNWDDTHDVVVGYMRKDCCE